MTNVQTPLPTRLPPPPRQVRRRAGAIPNNGCVMIPFALVGIGFLISIPVRLVVLSFGTPVNVVIDGKTVSRDHKRSNSTYHIQFHYMLNGQRHTDQQQVQNTEYNLAQKDQRSTGRAMQFAKWTVCISRVGNPNSNTIMLILFAAGWNGFIAIMLFFLIGPSMRAKRLVRDGTAAAGTLTGRRFVRGKTTNYYVSYTFKASDGTEMTREMTVFSPKLLETATEGAAITVLYDPGRPKRSVAYEYCGYEVVPMVG